MNDTQSIKSLLNNTENTRRSIVFCETLFHLFNTICIFSHYKNHAPVDIVFTDSSNFSRAKKILNKNGPFENVYTIDVKQKIKNLWQGTSTEERSKIAADAGSYLPELVLTHTYTDLWVNIDSMASKMFYYKLLKYGMTPYVHFIDEGTSSYVLDLSMSERDFINHDATYGKYAFTKRISDMWLHEPRIYSGGMKKYPLYQIPNAVLKNDDVKSLLLEIFGSCELPKEKFIFFEESFAADFRTTNDLELFLEIANLVGKENIIVKRHPRNPINRFEQLGFKVMEQQNIPWEIMLLNNNISDKVLISVGSSATLTPFFLYGMRPKTFLLKQLLVGKVPYLDNPKMDSFFQKSVNLFNQNIKVLYYPATIKELTLGIEYVNCNAYTEPENTPLFTAADNSLYDPLCEKKVQDAPKNQEVIEDKSDFIPYEEKSQIVNHKLSKLEKPYMSIIVPVYNVEKYLRRCLNSLVFQTVEDIEIIVVNDGSPDNSQAIIDEYAAIFPKKIVPLKKENGGLSSAREYGLKFAKGKYVGFVDSDDYLDCNYCKKCLEALLFEDTKAVAFCVNHLYEDGTIKSGKCPRDNSMQALILDMASSFWSKVYEREFLIKNAKFLNMWYEDIPVITPMLSYLDKVSILKDRLYFYLRDRKASITNNITDIRQLDALKAEKMAIDNINPIYRDCQIARSITRLISLDIPTFCAKVYQFVKSYRQDLQREAVRQHIPPNALLKIDEILQEKVQQIAANVYVGAFGKSEIEKADIKEKYLNKIFFGEQKIVLLDEHNCNLFENSVTKRLFNNGEYELLSEYFTAKAVYENGGIAINGDFIFNSSLDQFAYYNAFFGFNSSNAVSGAIFGSKKGFKLLGDICNRFIVKNGNLSVGACAEYYLVGEYGASLNGETQHLKNIAVFDAKVFFYKTDSSNVSILGSIKDNNFIKIPLESFEAQAVFTVENLVPLKKLVKAKDKNKALLLKDEKRLERITQLKQTVWDLRAENSKYYNRILELKDQKKAQNEKIATLKKENKKLKAKAEILNTLPFRVLLKLYKIFNKIFNRRNKK